MFLAHEEFVREMGVQCSNTNTHGEGGHDGVTHLQLAKQVIATHISYIIK